MRMSGALLAVPAVLALLASAPPAVAAPPDRPAYFWHWTDGSEARARTLTEHEYGTAGRLPRLVVQTHPATRGRHVVLQVQVDGLWGTEDSGTTDAHGGVRLQLNPYCADGAWCTRAFDYRLLVDGRRATIRVSFGR
jgi:hypothetical protein